MIPSTSAPPSRAAKDAEERFRSVLPGKRRRLAALVLALVCAAVLLCVALAAIRARAGAAGTRAARFPPDAAAVAAALEKSGLPGELSETETDSYADGHTLFVVRGEPLRPEGSRPAERELVASASCALVGGVRMLQAVFDRRDVPEDFAWEDWRKQFAFAALLFGGFGDCGEALFQAFAAQPVPERAFPWDTEIPGGYSRTYDWDAELPGGFCRVRCTQRRLRAEDAQGLQTWRCSATLYVELCGSRALFRERQEQAAFNAAGTAAET